MFSIVVTAHNAQGQLRRCLESVLGGHGAEDIEVVAVDNGSTDLTGPILEEFRTADPRLTLRRLPRRITAGPARDAGAELATGRYLLFIDATDRIVPGAVAALAARIAETGEPDVLIFDHEREHWREGTRPSGDARHLVRGATDAVTLVERPSLHRVARTLANRVLRRDFHAAHRELFDRDARDEVLPAWGSLLAAERIAFTDRVCLVRPEPEPAADHAFDLFDQYERVMAHVTVDGPARALHPAIFRAMVQHYLETIAGSGLAPADAARFFHRAAAHFAHHRPDGYRRPDGLTGIRHALLERGSYTGYRAMQRANRGRRELLATAGRAKRFAGEKAAGRYYREQLRAPLDPDLAVFSAYWDRGVTCSPAAVAAALGELAPHIRPVWIVRRSDAPLAPPGTTVVSPGDRRYWQVLARATYFVNNVNFPDALVKRPGQIHVQTHHGTPLKRMGVDQLAFPATSRGVDYDALMERCSRWDYSLSANRHSTETWERAYPTGFTSLDFGCPRNDVYYRATAEDIRRIRARLGIGDGTTALLYAPTHRDYESGWTPRLDLERLADTLGPGFRLLVRGHYFYDRGPSPLQALHSRGRIVDVSGYDSVEELSLAADALITDYSSVMFDYANLNRPVLVLADDWETYAVTRGVYFDITEEAPGVVARSQDELTDALLSGAYRGAEARERLARFRDRFCEFDDGHAAERVVRRVFLGERDVPPVVPVRERIPAPAPGDPALSLTDTR
ncbi:bifunctional glycosyltransferase family 2 protein/CDP-glycerol:glycerophosphate glycerophosphotransferase [Streptomyces sp. NPDC002004]